MDAACFASGRDCGSVKKTKLKTKRRRKKERREISIEKKKGGENILIKIKDSFY